MRSADPRFPPRASSGRRREPDAKVGVLRWSLAAFRDAVTRVVGPKTRSRSDAEKQKCRWALGGTMPPVCSLLIVDDHIDTRDALAELAEDEGHVHHEV